MTHDTLDKYSVKYFLKWLLSTTAVITGYVYDIRNLTSCIYSVKNL